MYTWTPISVIVTIFICLSMAYLFFRIIAHFYKKLNESDKRFDELYLEMRRFNSFVEYSTREDKEYDEFMEQKNAVASMAVTQLRTESPQTVMSRTEPTVSKGKKGGNVIERVTGMISGGRFNSTKNIPLDDANEAPTPIDPQIMPAAEDSGFDAEETYS